MRNIIFLSLLFSFSLVGGQVPTGDMIIRKGTVLTITKGTLTETDILVQKGKITAIGKVLKAPAGTKEIDATGLFVMPGIIDAHSHIGIDAVNEATNPITSEVKVGDAIDPFDLSIYRALAGGVTTSHAMHGSANVIGGQCQTIKHRYGLMDPSAFIFKDAPRTIKFALGENPIRVHGEGRGVQPRTRMGVERVIRNAFAEGQVYRDKMKAYELEKVKNPNAVPPVYNERYQTMADILDGKIIIQCHSYRADEILMLLNVLRDFGVKKITFQHANEGFKVAPELATFGAMASVFSDWWAYKFEVYYSTAYNATILTRNGVVTSINSDSGEMIRHLYYECAKTQRYGGLSDDEALSLITINPARQLGIDDKVGSIEIGKDADIAIFSGNPLSVYAVPLMTIVDGIIRFDKENDPSDMRIYIDPEEATPAYYGREEVDECMRGTDQMFNNRH
ncbi:MAG: amidohydrolase family protein [Saprospiraceae bacterium]|uniref:Amidohydrolase family protein n=1 Tax=Candidatus Opimibacter skivensis TaxID=2982028 RepID=A0A9D7SV36_9BACT|nr:amidohydrolase family protein [Candidatus Opimibacter skivensis]